MVCLEKRKPKIERGITFRAPGKGKIDEWMDDLIFLRPFLTIFQSYQAVCNGIPFIVDKIPPQAELETGTAWLISLSYPPHPTPGEIDIYTMSLSILICHACITLSRIYQAENYISSREFQTCKVDDRIQIEHTFFCFSLYFTERDRVVQSIVSLTSSLRCQLVKCFMTL